MAKRGGYVVLRSGSQDLSVWYGGADDVWVKVGTLQAKVPVKELREALEYVMGEHLAKREVPS